MGRSVNFVILVGNVGNEPEFKTTAAGKAVVKFSLATESGGRDNKRTQWHRVTAWEKTAEIVNQYVAKGDKLYVEGRIEYSETEGEGGKRYWTDIIAREIVLLGGKGEGYLAPPISSGAVSTTKTTASNPFADDDADAPLPF